MSRFNLRFKRTGRFYMEGEVAVDIDSDGKPLPVVDVISKAREGGYAAYRPTKIEYYDDDMMFYPVQSKVTIKPFTETVVPVDISPEDDPNAA